MPPKTPPFTDVHFGLVDGKRHSVKIAIGEWRTAYVLLEGEDLLNVHAAFVDLFRGGNDEGLEKYDLRRWRDSVASTCVDDQRRNWDRPKQREKHPLSWSLTRLDERPEELRLWVQSTRGGIYMSILMDKETTAEFGRRLEKAVNSPFSPRHRKTPCSRCGGTGNIGLVSTVRCPQC